MAGFINRWICKIKEGVDLNVDRIKKFDGHFWVEDGQKYKLGRLIKLNPEVQSPDGGIILSGKLYFNWEDEIEDYEILENGTLQGGKQIVRRMSILPFWISIDQRLICFPNSKTYTKIGMRRLSELFFQDSYAIKPVKFNIYAIEKAWKNGEFSVWAYYFRERQGSVDKGIHYGEDINLNDPLYQETATAPKNFIGIKLVIGDEEVKIRITRDGSLTIYSSIFNELQQQLELFRLIGDLLKYTIIE